MIVKKIYEHAKLHVDGDFPWIHARRWLNEAQNIIASTCDTGNVLDTITINTKQKNKWHSLPKKTIKINRVYFNGVKTNEFQEDNLKVFLPEIGEYLIEYKRLPKEIGLESDEPELHELYHFPISYWVASREQYRFNPDNPDGSRLEATFYQEIAFVDNMLKNKKRVRKIKV